MLTQPIIKYMTGMINMIMFALCYQHCPKLRIIVKVTLFYKQGYFDI